MNAIDRQHFYTESWYRWNVNRRVIIHAYRTVLTRQKWLLSVFLSSRQFVACPRCSVLIIMERSSKNGEWKRQMREDIASHFLRRPYFSLCPTSRTPWPIGWALCVAVSFRNYTTFRMIIFGKYRFPRVPRVRHSLKAGWVIADYVNFFCIPIS